MRHRHQHGADVHRPHRRLGAETNLNTVTYQPAGRFWALQGIEVGIFVALTAATLGATIWLLYRRSTWAA